MVVLQVACPPRTYSHNSSVAVPLSEAAVLEACLAAGCNNGDLQRHVRSTTSTRCLWRISTVEKFPNWPYRSRSSAQNARAEVAKKVPSRSVPVVMDTA